MKNNDGCVEQCNEFMHRIYKLCAAPCTNAFTMLQSTRELNAYHNNVQHQSTTSSKINYNQIRHIPTGMEALDNGLKGGFRVGNITEVVGKTGIGKSQLAMQLCIQAAMHYKQGSAYIDTESKLSLRRLHQIVEERLNILQENNYSNHHRLYNNDYSSLPILQNIRIQSPHSIDHLLHTLDQLEQTIITINHEHDQNNNMNNDKHYPIRLLVLDSIAAPLQREYNSSGPVESLTKRASIIFQIANKLKKMANELSLCVVVINQVISNDSIAALGMPWFHSISSRIVLEEGECRIPCLEEDDGGSDKNVTSVRVAKIVKSNVAGFSSVSFEIAASGLIEI